MRQVTLRIEDELAGRLKAVAAEMGRSVNSYATAVLRAALDPDLSTDEAERLRERLAQAGLLAPSLAGRRGRRPDAAAVKRARRRAGRGRALSDLVSEGRG